MKKSIILLIALIAVLGIGYSASMITGTVASAAPQPPKLALPVSAPAAPRFASVADLESTFGNIYTEVNPSVVKIDVVASATGRNVPTLPNAHPSVPPGGAQALGSGFIWDTQGNIVTNNHVIEGATKVTVTFSDGTIVPAKVIGADPSSDLAVIKVDASPNLLRPVQVADSKQVKVGQMAIAIGNPYGEQNTMTTGIVSAVGRTLPVSGGFAQGPSYSIPDVIQTDAPINPGNSGGVLLNAAGQVIGVTQSIESASGSSAGIGFAVPSAIVQRVVPALIKTGRYDHPYVGISGTTITPDLAQAMGLSANQRGAVVGSVIKGGPAEKAGVRGSANQGTVSGATGQVGGDVITAIDGQVVKGFDDLIGYLANSTQVNQTVTLTILRDGKEQTLKVTLAARPSS